VNNELRASPLDRLLRLFTEVHPGEGAKAALLALNVFLILMAYYILKPLREALILTETSPEFKSYMSAGQVGLLALLVPAYGSIAGRISRQKLINYVTWFFLGCIGLFFLLGQAGARIGIAYFLWIGIFNVMIVAQFWSFANDVYTREEGERLFPIVAFGASAGAVVGATLVGQLIEPLGVYSPMLVAAVVLFVQVQVTNYIDRLDTSARDPGDRGGPASEESATQDVPPPKESGPGAFRLVVACRYLLMIALLTMILNWVNTSGEYLLGRIVNTAAEAAVAEGTAGGLSEGQIIGKFYADFFGVVNLAGLLIQLFLVSRVIKYVGIRFAILILPLISFTAYGLIAIFPVLAVARWSKTAENSTDYSLNNTVRHALYLVCTQEQKYKAKQVTDAFFWRAGDVLSAAVVFAGTTFFAWSVSHFASFNLVLVVAWIALAYLIGKEYQSLIESGKPPSVAGMEGSGPEARGTLAATP
jgi:AAA family ATP:ADP antiporter